MTAKVVDFHPPISAFKAEPDPNDPEGYILNMGATIRIVKDSDTPKAKKLYRDYVAEYHALDGQPLSHEKREEVAFKAAAMKNGWSFVPYN